MKLIELLEMCINQNINVRIFFPIDAGTDHNYNVEICCEEHYSFASDDYKEWLKAMNLEVNYITLVEKGYNNNHPALAIYCKGLCVD
ncbi:MAG: hypothetical protein IJW67_11620 [Blautia sp.]|nr:hypothetical protein [Blautia sp.]